MDAILLIDKPAGMTSFDVVKQCKKIYGVKKTGHTGTLDPQATGLLIVLLGKYTKLLPYCVKDQKRYFAHFDLGYKTVTEDVWGKVTDTKEPHILTEEEIKDIEAHFIGDLEQTPPMYSAIKVDGKKLYEYARQDIEIEREKRNIHIDNIKIEHIENNTYSIDVTVSSGTYIRTLISDIGEYVNEYATMTSLRRLSIEHIHVDDAIKLDELNIDSKQIDPLDVLSKEYEIVEIENEKPILNGLPLSIENHRDKIICVKDHQLLAAYEKGDNGKYYCKRGLF